MPKQQFTWLTRSGALPARWDLRLVGWQLMAAEDRLAEDTVAAIYDGRDISRRPDWKALPAPGATIAVGVECARERGAMLAHGFGDALSSQVAVSELAIRFARLGQQAGALPRHRLLGPLTLDLLHRDARVGTLGSGSRWLALHPREFALLWRLADGAGERVVRETLLADVWRLAHVPETNSLEVHISRLRAKLAAAQAAWLIETDPGGGYRLARSACGPGWTSPDAMRTIAAN